MHRFQSAVDKALAAKEFETDASIKYNLEIVSSTEMPELSIIDYLMWAVQRKLLKGESRYFDALKDKYANPAKLVRRGRAIKKLKNLFAPVPLLATPIMG